MAAPNTAEQVRSEMLPILATHTQQINELQRKTKNIPEDCISNKDGVCEVKRELDAGSKHFEQIYKKLEEIQTTSGRHATALLYSILGGVVVGVIVAAATHFWK